MQRNAFRLSLIVLTAMVALAALGWGIFKSLKPTDVQWAVLCGGMQFTPTELAHLEAVLAQQGVEPWRVEDRRLLVPEERRHECLAALARAKALPQGLHRSSDEFLEDASPFDSRQTREYKHKLALQQDLSRVLNTMQGIVEATVKYDVSPPVGLNQRREQRALAAVRVEDGRELSMEQVISIQHTIAASLAGMRPEDVTVTDLNGCKTWSGVLAQPAAYFADGVQPASDVHPAAVPAAIRPAAMTSIPAQRDAAPPDRLAELWQTSLRQADAGRFQQVRLHVRWVAGDADAVEHRRRVATPAIGNAPAAISSADAVAGPTLAIEQPHLIAWIVVPPDDHTANERSLLEDDLKRLAQRTCPAAWSGGRVRQTVQIAWQAHRQGESTSPADDSRTIHVSVPTVPPTTAAAASPDAAGGPFPETPVKAATVFPVAPASRASSLFPFCGVLAAVAGVWCWLFRGGADEPAAEANPVEVEGEPGGESWEAEAPAVETAASPAPSRTGQRRAEPRRQDPFPHDVSWISS